jgi:hypothetical protein
VTDRGSLDLVVRPSWFALDAQIVPLANRLIQRTVRAIHPYARRNSRQIIYEREHVLALAVELRADLQKNSAWFVRNISIGLTSLTVS